MIRTALLAALVLTSPAKAATHAFCWIGANDYRMEGFISYPDTVDGIVTEDTVTDFGIAGYRGETLLGQWSLKDRTPSTSFILRFDTRTLSFPMGGIPAQGTYQEWNANGAVNNCGTPGFGFNGGNAFQDVCVNDTFIRESSIEPDTPLTVSANPETPCGPLPMSSLPPLLRHHG